MNLDSFKLERPVKGTTENPASWRVLEGPGGVWRGLEGPGGVWLFRGWRSNQRATLGVIDLAPMPPPDHYDVDGRAIHQRSDGSIRTEWAHSVHLTRFRPACFSLNICLFPWICPF